MPERRFLRVQGSPEGRQQGRVDVNHPTHEGLQQGWAEYLIVPGQHHEINVRRSKHRRHDRLLGLARGVVASTHYRCGNAGLAREAERRAAGPIGHRAYNTDQWMARREGCQERAEITPSARYQNPHPQRQFRF
jgi:hypothetical protein